MRKLRSYIAASVCAALLLSVPGPQAYAAVAAVRTAPAARPVPGGIGFSPMLAPHSGGLTGLGQASLSLNGVLPGLGVQPSINGAAEIPAALPAAAAAPEASISVVPAAPARKALTPVEDARPALSVSKRAAALSHSVAPIVEGISESASGTALRSAGAALEEALTGSSRASLTPSSTVRGRSPALGTLRSRLKQAKACDHHAEGFEPAGAAVQAPEPVAPEQSKNFGFYAAGVATAKVGIETLNLVVPILLLTQYGNATLVGTLFIASELAGMVASWVSGPLIDKYKPAKAMVASAAIQMVAIGSMPAMLALGFPIGLPLMFTLFVINGAMMGIFDTARRAALPHILGQDEGVLRQHNAKLYILREILSIAAVGAAGCLLGILGHITTLALHPAAFAIVLYSLIRLASRLRPSFKAAAAAEAQEAEEAAETGLKALLLGAKTVWKDKTLLLATLVNIPVITLHRLMHAILAAIYATQILGNPAMAAVLLMAWNAGELAAAVYLRKRSENKSSFGWLKYTAMVTMTLWALYAFPTIWVAAPAVFLLSTGNMSSELGLTAYFQAAAPKKDVGAVTGFIYSLATAASMGGLLAMGRIFDLLSPMGGFLVLAGAMSAMALLYLLAAKKLNPVEGGDPFKDFEPE